jgi:lipid II:glycine glycyltransferase (peptidoglycan interpeptide bridge formation enzyme)
VRIVLRRSGELMGGCQLLTRGIGRFGGIGYVPRGPILASRDAELFDAVLAVLRNHARKRRIAVVKIQPPIDRTDLPALLQSRGLVASSLHTAPTASVVVPVGSDRDEDEIFRALRATTRRRVRQARKQGINVRTGGADLTSDTLVGFGGEQPVDLW